MKMLMIICPEERQDVVQRLIAEHQVHAYSELREVVGEGAHGKKLGTHIWPQTSVLVFTTVPDEKVDELLEALSACASELYPAEGLRAFVLPVEKML